MRATPLETSHHNTGHRDGTRGILLASEIEVGQGAYDLKSTAVLLGDTEYQSDRGHPSARLFDTIRGAFSRPDLRVAVLHLGCSQLKEGTGKHLYLSGIVDLLDDIDQARWNAGRQFRPPNPRLLVLISEWGLEHASRAQVMRAVGGSLPACLQPFSDGTLLIKTIQVIRSACRPKTLDILPADLGLIAGIESGLVYLQSGPPVAAEEVHFSSNKDGLVYTRRISGPSRRGAAAD